MFALFCGATALAAIYAAAYRLRMGRVPRSFLAGSFVIFVEATLVQAFGVEAGAEIGNFFVIVVACTAVVGCITVEPRWPLMLAALLGAVAAASAYIAHAFAVIHITNPEVDEAAEALLALALLVGTLSVAVARDTPTGPRVLFIASLALKLLFPLTEVGYTNEFFGPYLAYAVLLLLIVAWAWYALAATRGRRRLTQASQFET
jgi:hypothetical protein